MAHIGPLSISQAKVNSLFPSRYILVSVPFAHYCCCLFPVYLTISFYRERMRKTAASAAMCMNGLKAAVTLRHIHVNRELCLAVKKHLSGKYLGGG